MKAITAFRITQNRFARAAFDGEGARLYGGRWNSPGTAMVYLASSISLATLELLVHTDDFTTIAGNYCIIEVEFDQSLVLKPPARELPMHWDSHVVSPATQLYGDHWAQGLASVVLEVPSAVVPAESVFLLNPRHKDFAKVEIGAAAHLRIDQRLR